MSDPTQAPIIVNPKAGPDQWAAAVRQALLVLAGIAAVFGWKHLAGDFSALLGIAAPLGGLIAFVLGQLATRRRSNQLTVLAKAAPDEIAQVRQG